MSSPPRRRRRVVDSPAHDASGAEPAPALAGLPVHVRGLRKRYGRVQALDGVDADFAPGRVGAILGPNGAGKTTLLKSLLGLVRPDGGEIALDTLRVHDGADYRRHIGYMPQLPNFPGNLTARELAALMDDLREFDGEPDEELIEALRLAPELDKPFRALSGGTRQKVNAALAFRFGAPVLVLDEPTSGLDPVAARVLKNKVRRERDRGRTVLLTSHDLGQVASLADDVVFLLDGTVRFAGPLPHLLASTGHEDLEGAVAELLQHPHLSVVP